MATHREPCRWGTYVIEPSVLLGWYLPKQTFHTDHVDRRAHLDLDDLLREASAAPPGNRVPEYRDRVAAYGSEAVGPLVHLMHEEPRRLGAFVIAVLGVISRRGSAPARVALQRIASTTIDQGLKAFATQQLGSHPTWTLAPTARDADGEDGTIPDRINRARARRGESLLDKQELNQVLRNLSRRAAKPDHYRNVCWYCHAVVDEMTNLHCDVCRWLVCWCGACREPDREWGARTGPCPVEAGRFGKELDYPTHDYQGRPIITANPPSPDAEALRTAIAERGLAALYHWTPVRGCASIIDRGILSRRELSHAGISFVRHGFGSHEKEAALDGYAGLTMRPKADMMRAWSVTPVIFEVSPEVIIGSGTLFVPGNSAWSGFDADTLRGLQGSHAFEQLWPQGSTAPVSQAEVWIRTRIPPAALTGIHVQGEEDREGLRKHLASLCKRRIPDIQVTPGIYG